LKKDSPPSTSAAAGGALQNAPRGEPFPAAPQAETTSPAPAPVRESAAAPQPPSATADTQVGASEQAAPSSAPMKAARTLTAAPAEERAQSAPAMAQSFAQAKPKAAPRGVDEWIKLIRDLRSEGRFDEASKELAAFRDAYGERADALLPADLRQLPAPFPAPAAK
jgi:hypothetical protein